MHALIGSQSSVPTVALHSAVPFPYLPKRTMIGVFPSIFKRQINNIANCLAAKIFVAYFWAYIHTIVSSSSLTCGSFVSDKVSCNSCVEAASKVIVCFSTLYSISTFSFFTAWYNTYSKGVFSSFFLWKWQVLCLFILKGGFPSVL